MADRSDLTDEEWEMLQRLDRGAPEALLVPGTILSRLVELRLAILRAGRGRVSEAGKQLLLKHRVRTG